MRTALLTALVLSILIGMGFLFRLQRDAGGFGMTGTHPPAARTVPEEKAEASHPDLVAADGVVEGARPEVAIRAELTGTLAAVHVHESQDVPQGTVLAELSNGPATQRVALAAAELARARAQLEMLRNGERAERRRAAAAVEAGKEAVFQQAKVDWERSRKLAEQRNASREELDRAYYTMLRSRAEWDEAAAAHALVEAPPRAEEVAIEEGNVAAAEARLHQAEAELAQTRLVAPSNGRILQIFAEPGEQAGPTMAQPILLMADLSKRRVRAFVEELDAAKVAPGQRTEITADGITDPKHPKADDPLHLIRFPGTVTLVMPRMGRRGPQSDAPGEYKDLYFRETLIDLDDGADLPLNLRVQVRITIAPEGPGPGPGHVVK
jgi:HlyD family secretion protein